MKKKLIYIILSLTLLISAIAIPACAAAFSRADRSAKSNLVVVGDSRIYYTYKSYSLGKTTSYSALVGGTYGWSNSSIIGGDKEATIKKYVQNCIKKHGSCRLVIEGTTNEVAWGAKPWTKIQDFANRAHKWSAKYNGKTVKPKVFVTEALKRKDGQYNAQHNTYNKENKAAAKKKGYTYINLTNPKAGDYVDNAHFTKAFSRSMHNEFIKKTK